MFDTDIENIDKEILLCNKQMVVAREILINDLQNDLGDSIINYLNKSSKETFFKKFRRIMGFYFRMFFKMFG